MMATSTTEREIFYQALTIRIRILIMIVSFFPMLLTTEILFYKFNRLYTEKMQGHTLELFQKHSQVGIGTRFRIWIPFQEEITKSI